MDILALEFPNAKHKVIGFDSVNGEIGAAREFEKLGFDVVETVVMTAKIVHAPPKVNLEAEYRPILTPEDWKQAIQLRLECNDDHEPEGYKIFVRSQDTRVRAHDRSWTGQLVGRVFKWQNGFGLGIISRAWRGQISER